MSANNEREGIMYVIYCDRLEIITIMYMYTYMYMYDCTHLKKILNVSNTTSRNWFWLKQNTKTVFHTTF